MNKLCIGLAILFAMFCLVVMPYQAKGAEVGTEAWAMQEEPEPAQSWYQRMFYPDVPYDDVEKILCGAMIASNIADAATTISAVHDGHRELNTLYGDHPSDGTVIGIKSGIALFVWWGANKVDDHFMRKLLLGTVTALNTGVAIHNATVN